MTLLHRLASIVRWIAHRKTAEQDLDDELQTFVDMAAADQIREGATPDEARRQAVIQLGGLAQAKDRVRTARHGAWLDQPCSLTSSPTTSPLPPSQRWLSWRSRPSRVLSRHAVRRASIR